MPDEVVFLAGMVALFVVGWAVTIGAEAVGRWMERRHIVADNTRKEA